MELTTAKRAINKLFRVQSGDFHAMKELEAGEIPLISCGDVNNGLVGYFDVPEDKTYQSALTVAYNGQPLTTKFHPYRFGAKDDVAVLVPLQPMRTETLIYVAAMLNRLTWRYSYGRKCFREKLEHVQIPILVEGPDEDAPLDEETIGRFYRQSYEGVVQGMAERMAFWDPETERPEVAETVNPERDLGQPVPHLPGL